MSEYSLNQMPGGSVRNVGLEKMFYHACFPVLWVRIRIRMDLHHFGKLDPDPHQTEKLDPDPDSHQSEKQDPDPHQSQKAKGK